MAELSSCYFCGAALDTALERTQVATTGGDPTTVVLCPSCRRKLTAVLDRTLDADPDAESESLLGRAAAGDVPATPANGDADEGDDAPPVADVTPDQGSTTPDATETPPGTDHSTSSSDGDAGASGGTSGATAVGGTDEPIFGSDDAGGDEGESVAETTADETDDGAPFGSRTAASGPGEAATAVRDAEGADETETPVRDAEPDATNESDDGDAADDAGGSPTPPDAETYNRVVRLLQNREFPVPRAEIEEVALNAYDIAPEDFRAVIDTAVDRGVLAEDGDQLTLPD